jgi:hypothetical protein
MSEDGEKFLLLVVLSTCACVACLVLGLVMGVHMGQAEFAASLLRR